jgi:hypothetical protein
MNMHKVSHIALCFLSATLLQAINLTTQYTHIDTGMPGVDCKIRKLALHEKEGILFGDAYTRYLKLNGMPLKNTFWEMGYHQHDLIQVIIKNDSNQPVILRGNAYLPEYSSHVVSVDAMLQNYSFLAQQTMGGLLAALGIFSAIGGGAFLFAVYGAINHETSARNIGGLSSILFLPIIAFVSFVAKKRKSFTEKYNALKKMGPVLKIKNATQEVVAENGVYIVPPQATFIDTLIINSQKVNKPDNSAGPPYVTQNTKI